MKIRYLVLFLIMFFTFGLIAEAKECSSEIVNAAKKVELTFEPKLYKEEGKDQWYYYINVTNITKDLYVETDICGRTYDTYTKKEHSNYVEPFYNRCTSTYEIYSNGNSCDEKLLYTKEYTLPILNIYSNRPICQKYKDYKFCQTTINEDILLSDIKKEIDKLEKKDPNAAKETKKSFLSKFLLYENNIENILLYGAIILGIALIVIIIRIIIVYKKKTK